jgi:hypothetical protein
VKCARDLVDPPPYDTVAQNVTKFNAFVFLEHFGKPLLWFHKPKISWQNMFWRQQKLETLSSPRVLLIRFVEITQKVYLHKQVISSFVCVFQDAVWSQMA